MRKTPNDKYKKQPDSANRSGTDAYNDNLHRLAFDHSLQANIIFTESSGKIIAANNAACKLLGYSKPGLLRKTKRTIFNTEETNFIKMMKHGIGAGKTDISVTGIKKGGKLFPCKINYALFTDPVGLGKVIITITDISQSIIKQKNIDTIKEKLVAFNISLAKSKQKGIDIKKSKIVADNIVLAKSKQKGIDTEKKKIVSDNISFAKSKQKRIDIKKSKIVSDNISLAKSKQKGIDIKKNKIVADNIDLAKSKQKGIDTKKSKLVSDNINLAKSKQKRIDIKKSKIVAENIVLAKSRQRGIDTEKKKIVSDNINLAKSKQKGIDTKKSKIVSDNIILAKSKQKRIDIKKNKIVADNIVLAKSKQKTIDSKKEQIVADNIILARAKSDDEKLELGVISKAEFEESFRLIFNSTSDVLFDSDLISNKVIISAPYENEFGHKITGDSSEMEDWASHIHKDDLEAVMEDYRRMILSEETEWNSSYRFLKADGSVVNVISSRLVLRNADGKAYRMIGSMQDASKQKVLEERLAQEIRLKEKQIAEATVDAREAVRSDIGKELHDNVNQLLGASKMYLDMAKRGGSNSETCLARSSQYTLAAIEAIRKLTKGLTTDTIKNLGLCEAITNVISDTMEVNPADLLADPIWVSLVQRYTTGLSGNNGFQSSAALSTASVKGNVTVNAQPLPG